MEATTGKRGGVEWPGVILENKGWGVFNGWGQFKPTQDAYRVAMMEEQRTAYGYPQIWPGSVLG